MMCFDRTQNCSHLVPPTFITHHTQKVCPLCSLFLLKYNSIRKNLCFSNILGYMAFPWRVVTLPWLTLLEETDYLSTRRYKLSSVAGVIAGISCPTPFPMTGFNLFYVCCNSCCEFICAAVLLCSENCSFIVLYCLTLILFPFPLLR